MNIFIQKFMFKTENKLNVIILTLITPKNAKHLMVLKKNYFLHKRFDFILALKAKNMGDMCQIASTFEKKNCRVLYLRTPLYDTSHY